MRLRKLVTSVLVAGTALSSLPALSGCYATTYGTSGYVAVDLPPPREEIVVYRPGYVWVHGRWVSRGRSWVWRGGYYERERPNQVFVQGYWEHRGRNHVWVDGGWRRTGRVVIRR
ncbi:MAG: hypothetical protein H6Q90_6651 [Deltaproteobacteria bacterium]|nr:hypothetical protein [Deltaproteobacteria bacterium]